MSTIRELVGKLHTIELGDGYEVGPAIFARRPWSPDSEARILHEDWLDSKQRPGFRLVLDVKIAREVLDVWSAWRGGARPTLDQAVEAVLHYATHDAYLPVNDHD